MTTQYEASINAQDGTELFYNYWKTEDAKGTLLLTHGLAEHSECYKNLATQLNKNHWDVIGWDLRGHGRSGGKRGYISNFQNFLYDQKLMIEEIQKNHHKEGNPFVLFAHSLGGLISTRTLLRFPDLKVDGLCLSSPCLGLAIKVPPLKKKIAEVGSQWFPKVTLWNEIRHEDLTRDHKHLSTYANDPLRHDKISPNLFTGMLEGFEIIKENASDLSLPLLLQVAGNDPIVSKDDAISFFENTTGTKKEVIFYEDSLHEIYNDLDKEQATRDLIKFIKTLQGNNDL